MTQVGKSIKKKAETTIFMLSHPKFLWQHIVAFLGFGERYRKGWTRTGDKIRTAILEFSDLHDLHVEEKYDIHKGILPDANAIKYCEREKPGAAEWIISRAELM